MAVEFRYDSLVEVIQSLYNSEINFGMQACYDAGIEIWVGSSRGQSVSQTIHGAVISSEIKKKLIELAVMEYPESSFAIQFRHIAIESLAKQKYEMWMLMRSKFAGLTDTTPVWDELDEPSKAAWNALIGELMKNKEIPIG